MSLDIACKDTIAALSSAKGHAALAIVRASGPAAFDIFKRIFKRHRGEIKNFVAMHGQVLDADALPIDDAVGIYFPQGSSFTGDASFEIHCHGNPLIIKQLLAAITQLGGRLAEAGEFSMRALLNGKIDLAQAESIADLIHAESNAARDAALKGVRGGLSLQCAPIREIIVRVLSELEARMDFPDEELGSFDKRALINNIDDGIKRLDSMLKNANAALRLYEGVRLVLIGRPNAGKSTLLNRLLGVERAIVHESAGTTRDVIEGRMEIAGVPVVAVDIAGIREMADASPIEQIGIKKALMELARADIVVWLADCTLSAPFGDELIEQELRGHNAAIIKVLNKCELLPNDAKSHEGLLISAALGLGIEELLEIIAKLLDQPASDQIFITRARQGEELRVARESLQMAGMALSDAIADEVVCAELRTGALAFDRLFGTTISEDVLDRIFLNFALGNDHGEASEDKA